MSEKCFCLLCGGSAVRSGYRTEGQDQNVGSGWKYSECAGECKPYALDHGAHTHIELFVKSPEKRSAIAAFVNKEYSSRTSQDKPFFPITVEDLRRLGFKK